MTDIKFIGTNQVELINSLSENKISPVSSGESFIEFSVDSTLSKDSSDYYHFVITGSNVQISGQITEVHKDYQFFNLFAGQEAITDVSELQLTAPNMKKFCYANMFLDCKNLTSPPTINASTLDEWCYSSMFGNCESLSSAPILSATTLAPYCYFGMFYNCKSLVEAPNLPAETLTDWCYNSMFFGCSNLTSISADFESWQPQNATTNWVIGIETDGEFFNYNVEKIYGVDYVPQSWRELSTIPLTFKALNGPANISITGLITMDSSVTQIPTIDMFYSKNNSAWTTYTVGETIELNEGDVVSFSGFNSSGINASYSSHNYIWPDYYHKFVTSGSSLKIYGNIKSLTYFSQTIINHQFEFYSLFSGCTNIVDASNLILPSTVLSWCYERMFKGCSSLTSTPNLPATTMQQGCYNSMFEGCTSLSSVPTDLLSSTKLYNRCYQLMFKGCSSLTSTPNLPATTLANTCYRGMFSDCTSLTDAPYLPATTLANNCYYQMFKNCPSLTDAPDLPATTLVNSCYREMFNSCSSLSSINVSFTNWTEATNATLNWVSNVASDGNFIKPAALSAEYGDGRIPVGWIVVDKT